MADNWVSPTGSYPWTLWMDRQFAYDEETGTYAWTIVGAEESGSIDYTIDAVNCDKVRFWVSDDGGDFTLTLSVYYEGGWHEIYQGGGYVRGDWVEKPLLNGTKSVTAIKPLFYNEDEEESHYVNIHELDFNQVAAAIVRPLVGGSLAAGKKGLV